MTNAAIIVLAGAESHADLGRLTNALETAKEFEQEGEEAQVIFDGAGTQRVAELESDDHPASPLYRSLIERVQVCDYCAGAFGVEEAVADSDAEVVAEFEGHPSIRSLVADGYEVLTF